MELRIWKRIFLTPWIRLNLYTQGFSISVGHSRIGWITFGRRGIRATLDTGVPGTYVTEGRTWGQLGKQK
jgi:hypothetical protein